MAVRMTGITGLLDTDALVKANMIPYRLKVDTLKQKEQVSEWKQEQYRAIMKSADSLYNKYLTSNGSSSLISASAYNSTKYTSTSDTTVTATTSSGATINNYSVSVTQLAAKATTILSNTDLLSSDKLSFSMNIDGVDETIDIDTTGKTNAEITLELNSKFTEKGIKVTAKNSEFAQGIVLESTEMGKDISFTAALTKDAGATVINTLTKDAKGKNLNATITSGTTTYTIDDASNVTENKKTLDGITFNFKDVTNASGTDNPVKLTGGKDSTALKDRIISFMKDYNELMASINTKLYETRNKSYTPLTEEQKDEMSDDEITKWEKKAQTGLLRKDSNLEELANSMKSAMSGIIGDSLISSSGLTLEKIGIVPVKDYKEQNGIYEVNEEALKTALENNFDAIKELFIKNVASEDTSNSGIIPKLEKVLNDNVKKSNSLFKNLAGDESGVSALTSTLSKQITEMKKKISEMEKALTDRENILYNKYSRLESALSSLQSQQANLSSYFGNGK